MENLDHLSEGSEATLDTDLSWPANTELLPAPVPLGKVNGEFVYYEIDLLPDPTMTEGQPDQAPQDLQPIPIPPTD
jgi:hypothetical protein